MKVTFLTILIGLAAKVAIGADEIPVNSNEAVQNPGVGARLPLPPPPPPITPGYGYYQPPRIPYYGKDGPFYMVPANQYAAVPGQPLPPVGYQPAQNPAGQPPFLPGGLAQGGTGSGGELPQQQSGEEQLPFPVEFHPPGEDETNLPSEPASDSGIKVPSEAPQYEVEE